MSGASSEVNSSDWLYAFAFADYPVRGALACLPDTWQALSSRRQYPHPMDHWLADMLTSIALIRSGIKASGRLSLQIRGQANPHLLSVECNEHWQLRGMARYRAQLALADKLSEIDSGLLTMQLEPPGEGVSYQGVVPLAGDRIAEAMQNYFQKSEQLPTCFILGFTEQCPTGLMLQRMPGEMAEDDWRRINMLAATLSHHELQQQQPEKLLKKLFYEEQIELFAAQSPRFCCSCSRERVSRMLLQLGHEEASSIVAEQGRVDVACEHCGEGYGFDQIDIEHLFASQDAAAPVSDRVQ